MLFIVLDWDDNAMTGGAWLPSLQLSFYRRYRLKLFIDSFLKNLPRWVKVSASVSELFSQQNQMGLMDQRYYQVLFTVSKRQHPFFSPTIAVAGTNCYNVTGSHVEGKDL